MSSGIPDLENEAKETDKIDEDIEIKDSLRPDLRKLLKNNFGDTKYKIYTDEFDEAQKLKN